MKLTKNKRSKAKKVIDEQIEKLVLDATTEDEIKAALILMEKRQALEKDKKKLDPNTILIAAAGILQIMAILYREEIGHVVTSKALSFVIKGRV